MSSSSSITRFFHPVHPEEGEERTTADETPKHQTNKVKDDDHVDETEFNDDEEKRRGKIATSLLFRHALRRFRKSECNDERRDEVDDDDDSIDVHLIHHTAQQVMELEEPRRDDKGPKADLETNEMLEDPKDHGPDERRVEAEGVEAAVEVPAEGHQSPLSTPSEPQLFKNCRKRLVRSSGAKNSKRRRRSKSSNKVFYSSGPRTCHGRHINYDSDVLDLEVLATFDEQSFQKEQLLRKEQASDGSDKKSRGLRRSCGDAEFVFGDLVAKPLIPSSDGPPCNGDAQTIKKAGREDTEKAKFNEAKPVEAGKKMKANAFELMMSNRKKKTTINTETETTSQTVTSLHESEGPKSETNGESSTPISVNGSKIREIKGSEDPRGAVYKGGINEEEATVIDISQSDGPSSDEEVPRVLTRRIKRRAVPLREVHTSNNEEPQMVEKKEAQTDEKDEGQNDLRRNEVEVINSSSSIKTKLAPIFNMTKSSKQVPPVKKSNSGAIKAFLNSEAPPSMRQVLRMETNQRVSLSNTVCFPKLSHLGTARDCEGAMQQPMENWWPLRSLRSECKSEVFNNLLLSVNSKALEFFKTQKCLRAECDTLKFQHGFPTLERLTSPEMFAVVKTMMKRDFSSSSFPSSFALLGTFTRLVERKVDSEAIEKEALMTEQSLNEIAEGGNFLRQRRKRRASASLINERKRKTGVICTKNRRFEEEQDPELRPLKSSSSSSLLWTVKYAPAAREDIVGNLEAVSQLSEWLSQWQKKTTTSSQEDDGEDDDYNAYHDDEDDEDVCSASDTNNAVLLTGSHGVGKTCTVYALAAEMGLKVLEVNAASVRSGRSVAQRLQEATQSHHVKRGQESKELGPRSKTATMGALVLFEDVDVVFDGDDDGFYNALTQIVLESKRPVVMTSSLSNNYLPPLKFKPQRISFVKPTKSQVAEYLQLISLTEGFFVQLETLMDLVASNDLNVGRSILALQCELCSTLSNNLSDTITTHHDLCAYDQETATRSEQESNLKKLLQLTDDVDVKGTTKSITTVNQLRAALDPEERNYRGVNDVDMNSEAELRVKVEDNEQGASGEEGNTDKRREWEAVKSTFKKADLRSNYSLFNDVTARSNVAQTKSCVEDSSLIRGCRDDSDIDYSPLSSELVIVNSRSFNQDLLPLARSMARSEAERRATLTTTTSASGRRSRSTRFLHYFESQDIFITAQTSLQLCNTFHKS